MAPFPIDIPAFEASPESLMVLDHVVRDLSFHIIRCNDFELPVAGGAAGL